MKLQIFGLIAALAVPLWAGDGYVYTAETISQNMDQSRQDVSLVHAWISGPNAKILFQQSGNPVAKEGTYLLTADGGETIYLVNPEEKTYMEWSMDQLMALAASFSNLANLEFSNSRVDKLEESSGETMHGFKTTRYKFKTTYDMQLRMMGLKQFSSVETITESWVTDKIKDAGFGLWLRKEPPTTGDEDLDRLISTEMEKVKGFPLKSKSKTVTRNYNRKRTRVKDESITLTETVVKEWKTQNIDAAIYQIPDDYQLVTMPGTEKGNPLKGLFKRN